MARGACFKVSRYCDEAGCFNEEFLYKHVDALGVDYVEDMDESSSLINIGRFLKKLDDAGAITGEEDGTPFFTLSSDVKCKYFCSRFDRAKNMINEMALEDFACRDPYKLRWEICDTVSDCVFEEYVMNMDTFIREAKCYVKYYIGKRVVLMH